MKESLHIRDLVVGYMREHLNDKFCGEQLKDWLNMVASDRRINQTYETYLKEMDRDSTWGGAPEISIFSEMFRIIVKVHGRGKEVVFNTVKPDKTPVAIIEIHWSGSHYTLEKVSHL